MTYQIIYSSESSTPMQHDDLEEILVHARSRNAVNGITGALVYVEGVFLQILEGDKARVEELMAKISRDVRHETLTVLRETEQAEPVFGDWRMAYVSATAEQVAKWAGLSHTATVPEVVGDLQEDPLRAAQVAQSILALLTTGSARPVEGD